MFFRPPKRLTSTFCIYFRQQQTTALLEPAEGERKACVPDRVSNPGPEAHESDARATDCATRPG